MSEIIVNVYNEDVTIGVTEIIETVTLTINENMSGDVNTINTISKNGVQLPIVLKNVDIEVPTKTSDLTNDSDFVSDADYATDKLRLANTSGTNTGDQDLSDLQTKIGATLETTATTIEAAINEVRTIALGSDIANASATNANNAAEAANAVAGNIVELQQAIELVEAQRVISEDARTQAETTRDNSETGRTEAEQLRATAEGDRAAAELIRIQNENERIANIGDLNTILDDINGEVI